VEGSFAISDHNGPHAHCLQSDPSGKFAFSTDLGLDRIYQWVLDAGALTPNQPPYIDASSAGAGPRHFVFHPNGTTVFLVNEEASTLTSYHFSPNSGTLTALHTVSSLPPEYKGTAFAGGIALSKAGDFLYVANRLHNSIAQFSVDEAGSFKFVGNTWTRGDYPRTVILSPSGVVPTLYALNQRSDNITCFQVERSTGRLSFSGYLPVGSPSEMVFVSNS
jgi:6-phosphogluconolactonase (cycloisomerase 2 family)